MAASDELSEKVLTSTLAPAWSRIFINLTGLGSSQVWEGRQVTDYSLSAPRAWLLTFSFPV